MEPRRRRSATRGQRKRVTRRDLNFMMPPCARPSKSGRRRSPCHNRTETLPYIRVAGNVTIQRVPSLGQLCGAEAKSLDGLWIEKQSAGSPIANEQTHFRIRLDPHGAPIFLRENYGRPMDLGGVNRGSSPQFDHGRLAALTSRVRTNRGMRSPACTLPRGEELGSDRHGKGGVPHR